MNNLEVGKSYLLYPFKAPCLVVGTDPFKSILLFEGDSLPVELDTEAVKRNITPINSCETCNCVKH